MPPLPAADAARSKFSMLFINALACYLLVYQAVHLVSEAAMIFMARRANILGIWSLSGVRFILGDGGWHRDNVLVVYGLGPALVVGLVVVAFGLFWRRLRHRRGLAKLLLLLSKVPHAGLNEVLHFATMGLLLVALGCNQEFSNGNEVLPYPTRVAWGLVGLALLGLLAWRLALGAPLAFR